MNTISSGPIAQVEGNLTVVNEVAGSILQRNLWVFVFIFFYFSEMAPYNTRK